MCKKNKKIINDTIKNGTIVNAKIINYRDGQGASLNGLAPLDIVVECIYRKKHRKFVETNAYSEAKYTLFTNRDKVVIVPKTLEF